LLWRCLLVHAVHCSVAQHSRLIPLSVSPNSDESGKQSPYPDDDPDRHQNLTIWPIANLPWKFHANPFGSFCAKLLTDRQTNKQTNNDENISSLTEVIKPNKIELSLILVTPLVWKQTASILLCYWEKNNTANTAVNAADNFRQKTTWKQFRDRNSSTSASAGLQDANPTIQP